MDALRVCLTHHRQIAMGESIDYDDAPLYIRE